MVLSHISQNDGMIEAIVDTAASDTNTTLRSSSSPIMSRRAARVYDFLEATLVELDERWRALQSYQEDKLELFRLNCESELFLRLCDVDSGPMPKTPGRESWNGNALLRDERRVIWKLEV